MPDEHEDYLHQCVTVDDVAINEEYIRLSADYAFWSAKYADARKTHAISKLERETVRSSLRITLREELETEGGRVTESMVTSAVDVSPKWIGAKRFEIDAETEMVKLNGVLEALKTKREMLISIGAHARAEMKAI